MNKKRRKELQIAIQYLNQASDIVEKANDEEQDYLDSIPENLQAGEIALKAEDAVDNLEDAMAEISSAIECIQNAME